MSGKIYNKNLTFLQDQPFAENFVTGSPYNKRRGKVLKKDSFLHSHRNGSSVSIQSFGLSRSRNKSERMKKAETSLVKHFCLSLEREPKHNLGYSRPLPVVNSTPHLLVSVDSMRNTLLSTRSSRTTERVKTPSQFKKILRECRKIRLLYGNLSKRHLSRATSKIRLPGENLLIWLESRLEVVLERSGFFGTVKAARRSVLNGKILVNSKVVRSPGFILKGGDLIKVIQERLPTESLNRQSSILKRGVVLSTELLTRLTDQTLFGSFAISKPEKSSGSLKASKTSESKALLLEKKKKVFGEPNSVWLDKKVDKIGTYRGPALGKSKRSLVRSYKSFYTWLMDQKQKEFGVSPERPSEGLLKTDLQTKVRTKQGLMTEPNFVWLGKKVSSSNTFQSWRFLGSPHLLFSLFYLHAHLASLKVMSLSSLAQTLNEGVLAETQTPSKKGFKVGKYKSYKTRNWNKASTCVPENTLRRSAPSTKCVRSCFESSLIGDYKDDSSLPTILSLSGHCAINRLGIKVEPHTSQTSEGKNIRGPLKIPTPNTLLRTKPAIDGLNPFLNLIRQFFTLHLSSERNGVKERDSHQTLDLLEVSSNPKVSRTFTSKRGGVLTPIHEFFKIFKDHKDHGEDHVRAVIEVYNNLFTTPITSFTQSALHEYFSNLLWGQIPLSLKRTETRLGVSVAQGVGENSMKLLFSDLLFYSLLIKKEHFCVQLKKQQLDPSCPKPLWSSASRITSDSKERAFDLEANPNLGLRAAGPNSATENTSSYKTSFASRARVFAPLKTEHKKVDLNQGFDLGQARRIKPLHLEVSYQSLCVVYLYPTQRVCLPVMIDVNCLAKAF